MYQIIKKILLLGVLSISLILAACGGAGGSGGTTTADTVTINGTTYTENGSILRVDGFLYQVSPDAYRYGGPIAHIYMNDSQSGNTLFLQTGGAASGWGISYLVGATSDTYAVMTDKSVLTSGYMMDLSNGNGTGGSITINAFGDIGQPITGSFNVNLCNSNAVCSASIKNYTGTFSMNRIANYGSLTRPALAQISVSTPVAYAYGIHPATGKNYYIIPTNATGGTLTLTLTPIADVNMAVFTDAGFTIPATCNVTSTLNVVGSGVETCAITVAANQRLYLTVSQTTTATGFETYSLKVAY